MSRKKFSKRRGNIDKVFPTEKVTKMQLNNCVTKKYDWSASEPYFAIFSKLYPMI